MSHITSHTQDILPEVERFLAASGMKPTRFGRSISNDPHFVESLRKGRRVFPWTAKKARMFMARHARAKREKGVKG